MSNQPTLTSMPAGRRGMYADESRPTPYTAPKVTPYLGLRSRLSQIWINRWTILLLLVLARCLIAVSGVRGDLDSARREALSACTTVESMGSAMASMPHYMAQGVNELTATGVEKSVNALIEMTTMTVTGVEEIVLFVINMMTSTYLCLITLAVRGTVSVAVDVLKEAQDSMNEAIDNIGDDMGKAVNTFLDAYKKVQEALNSATLGFANSVDPPDLDLSRQLNALKDLKLPFDIKDDLDKMEKNIPTFEQVQNTTETVLRIPFEELKRMMRNKMGNYTFDRSVFPVPQKEQLTFCSDNNQIDSFFDSLFQLTIKAKTIFIGVLVAAAIAVCIPMAWREIRRWRHMQERSRLIGSNAHDPLDVAYIVSRPYTSSAGIKAAHVFHRTRRQVLVRWVMAYATSDAALFVLTLGLAGLFSCVCQIIMLRAFQKEVPNLTDQVGQFAGQVVQSLNNASEQWAVGTNKAIVATSDELNEDLFGWIQFAADNLNTTLNSFTGAVQRTLDDVFGDTPLKDPIQEVIKCLILLKIAGLQKAVTWVSDNAHINFPLMDKDTFSMGAIASLASDDDQSESFLANPGDKAKDKITAAVLRVTRRIESNIRTEALISTVVVLIWVLIVIMAIGRALTLWFGRDKTRGEGGVPDSHYPDTPRNIALENVTPRPSRDTTLGPAPEYSQEHGSPGQKFGFAGHRDYSASTQEVKGGHARTSSHGEVFGNKW